MAEDLYDIALQITDEVLGPGTYATINARNPDPGVQAAIARTVKVPDDITPTEYLVMEVLAARHRIGEYHWTFPPFLLSALRKLEKRNLIGFQSGVIEKTFVAWMSDLGKRTWLSTSYSAPPATKGTHMRNDAGELQHLAEPITPPLPGHYGDGTMGGGARAVCKVCDREIVYLRLGEWYHVGPPLSMEWPP